MNEKKQKTVTMMSLRRFTFTTTPNVQVTVSDKKSIKHGEHPTFPNVPHFYRRMFLILALFWGLVGNVTGQSELTTDLFHSWSGPGAGATDNGTTVCALDKNNSTGLFYGDSNVNYLKYADLSSYKSLVLTVTSGTPRLIFNRAEPVDGGDPNGGAFIEINSESSDFVSVQNSLWVVDLKGIVDSQGYAHLNSIKGANYQNVTVKEAFLYTDSYSLFTMGDESKCKTHALYQQKSDATSFIVNLSAFKDKIVNAFGKSSITDFTTFYLRWYVLDKNTGQYLKVQNDILSAVGGTHHSEDIGLLWFNETGTAFPDDETSTYALNVQVKLPTGYTQSDVSMVCVMTDDLSDLYMKHEPTNLKHKIYVQFIDQTEAQSVFVMTDNEPTQTEQKSLKITYGATATASGQLKEAFASLYDKVISAGGSLEGSTPLYAHIYLTTKSGTMVSTLKDNGWESVFGRDSWDLNYYTNKYRGIIYTGDSYNYSTGAVFNWILAKPSGYEWNDLRVVCDIADDLTGSYSIGSSMVEEPKNLKARLILNLKESYGDTYTSTVNPSLETGMTIIRSHNSLTTASLSLTESDDFANVNAQFGNNLGNGTNKTNLYVRWYLVDEDGEWMPTPDGMTLTPVAVSDYQDLVRDGKNLGKLLYTGSSGQTVTADMLKVNISITDSEVDLNDYRIACVLTEVADFLPESTTPEPAIRVKYIYDFKSPFDGKVLSDAYKHTKELFLTEAEKTAGVVEIPLNQYYSEFINDYHTTAGVLGNNLHLRWYVEYHGEILASSENYLAPVDATIGYKTKSGYGIYWNSATAGTTNPLAGNLNIKFTKPIGSDFWENYKVVVVMSNDLSAGNGQEESGGELVREPQTLNMKYTFSLFEPGFRFVHHKGAAGRDYLTSADDGYISTSSPIKQYSWNNDQSSIEEWSRNDIRQGVHTVDYNVFVKPGDTEKKLLLPFEGYLGGGNNLEPMAYIRWYDWANDLCSSHLTKASADDISWLESKIDATGNRGLFMVNNCWADQKPTHAKVGVIYNPAGLTTSGDIVACDVGKYYDGLYPGQTTDGRADFAAQGFMSPQFLHEPTLSTRYLFHIYPSSVIVSDIKTGDDRFKAALSSLGSSGSFAELRRTMFNLYEDNGRVIVSLNGSSGDFAVRANLQSIDNYYISDGTSDGKQCTALRWRAFLEDESGLWAGPDVLSPKESSGRIFTFDLSRLSGTYSPLAGGSTKSVTAAPGMRFHVIGYVGDGTDEGEAAAIHYELQFINAPAYKAEELVEKDVKRTDEYLRLHLDPAGEVTFDKYFQTGTGETDYSQPLTQKENMLFHPLSWNEAQYGFCYPSIDKYRIKTNYSGLTPIHGDYMLLKSIKVSGVSDQATGLDQPAPGADYVYWWYTYGGPMYDYTQTITDQSKYGGFIYVDASDESRTIATLDFDANLCSGSQIFFTAAIADVTAGGADGGKTSPQLMAHVYAYEKDAQGHKTGERKLIISFLTSVLRTVAENGLSAYVYDKWYQVYGYGTIPETIDITNYDEYTVEIDNYSKDTDGADFCVDQISFYTSTAQVQIMQNDVDCNVDKITMSIFMDGESLKTALGATDEKKTIYWSICDEAGRPLENIYNIGHSTQLASGSYGKIELTPNYTLNTDGTVSDASAAEGFYKENGNVYFRLINDQLPLEEGTRYYVSIYSLNNIPSGPSPTDTGWGAPTKGCTVCSSYFVAQKMHLTFSAYGGDVTGTVTGTCGGGVVEVTTGIDLKRPDSSLPSGFQSFSDLHFDFFKGSNDDLLALLHEVNGSYGVDHLVTALRNFRTWDNTQHSSYTDYQTDPSGLSTDIATFKSSYAEDGAIMEKVAAKMILSASTSFKDQMSGTEAREFDYMAFPLESTIQISATESKAICSPLSFSFNFEPASSGPSLTLGFDDVDYSAAGTKRVLRVGLEQLNKMRTQGYKLHIPVNAFKDKNQQTTGKVYFPSDSYLTISAVDKAASPAVPNTTDPTLPAVGTNFAKIVPINDTEIRPWVDKNHMYISLDLSGDNCQIDFHEGYEYEVATTFHDAEDEDNANACIGDLFIVVKVVPEFVTWQSQPVGADGKTTTTSDYYSANWYNDDNWKRSTRAELYKDVNNSDAQQNTPTAGHPNGYDNNGEGSLSSITDTGNPGFVPMKFTYVILPTGNHAPSLINEPRVVGEGKGSRRQGGGFLDLTQTTLLTDRSPRDPDGTANEDRTNSKPTDNIYYDMLVRYSYSATDKFGEGCFGHRYMKDDGTWDDQGEENLSAKVFDVEKFQGNICNEIYFKPGAELLRQQRLTYKRAWVETELYANKWYLLASPLQCTYAGDMYVPFANGRQETEAFQPISFDKSKGYSRTKYPIYQRSWGMNNGNVYVKENDIRANSYSANLKYSTVTTNLVEWGHTFNDVQVPYHTSEASLSQNLAGFSIRAHKKDQTDKTLIRLPKADTSYEYYDWTDTNSDPAATGVKAVSKPDYAFQQESETLFTVPYCYRLVTDEHQHDGDLEYSISAMQQNGDYVLVGNPYMVSIDMKLFFETNSTLSTDGYWTYEGSTATAYTVPTQTNTQLMKPMQAFFVKKGTAEKITFNRSMQVDGNFPPPASGGGNARAVSLTLRTANSLGGSSANIELNEKTSANYAGGEDVETLFDSNLSDVPMVYTVAADGRAVSIDNRPSMEVVPFGVACAASDEPVEVTVETSHFSPLASHLFIWDAVTGETKEVGEGSTFAVQPNDYGRYFLTTRSDLTGISNTSATDGIIVSVRHRQLTVCSASELTSVRVLTLGGDTVASQTDCGREVSFNLALGGVYIVEVETENDRKTRKVIVK